MEFNGNWLDYAVDIPDFPSLQAKKCQEKVKMDVFC